MPVPVVRLTRSQNAAGELVVRLGVPLLDGYLEFLAGRCRPNTVLAVAYDLTVFFTVAGKSPRRGGAAGVGAFMIASGLGGGTPRGRGRRMRSGGVWGARARGT